MLFELLLLKNKEVLETSIVICYDITLVLLHCLLILFENSATVYKSEIKWKKVRKVHENRELRNYM